MLDGEGILFFPMGGFIHGFFQRNRLNGAAFFKFENGDIYEGFWRNGKLEGNCYKYFTDHDRWILSDYKAGEFKKILAKGDGLPPSCKKQIKKLTRKKKEEQYLKITTPTITNNLF